MSLKQFPVRIALTLPSEHAHTNIHARSLAQSDTHATCAHARLQPRCAATVAALSWPCHLVSMCRFPSVDLSHLLGSSVALEVLGGCRPLSAGHISSRPPTMFLSIALMQPASLLLPARTRIHEGLINVHCKRAQLVLARTFAACCVYSFSTIRTKQVKDPLAYENIPARLKAEIFDVNKSWCVRTHACAYLSEYVRVAVNSAFGNVYVSLSAQRFTHAHVAGKSCATRRRLSRARTRYHAFIPTKTRISKPAYTLMLMRCRPWTVSRT